MIHEKVPENKRRKVDQGEALTDRILGERMAIIEQMENRRLDEVLNDWKNCWL